MEISWFRVNYPSGAQCRFCGTDSYELAKIIMGGEIPEYIKVSDDGQLVGTIFNSLSKVFIEITDDLIVEKFSTEPELERGVDKFASAYI